MFRLLSVRSSAPVALAAVAMLLGTASAAGGESLPTRTQQPVARPQQAGTPIRTGRTIRNEVAGAQVIQAYDFGFNAPASMPSGVVNFSFQNTGAVDHMAQFIKLSDGVTAGDVLAAIKNGDPYDAFNLGAPAGGANGVQAGSETDFTLSMTPGNYVMLDYFTGTDNVVYAAKGSFGAFTVTGDVSPAVAPNADLTITALDGTWDVPPITPGLHEVQFVNPTADPHEMAVELLTSNATPDQMQQDPQSETETQAFTELPYGGIAGIAPGQRAWVLVDFEPGLYMVACYMKDPDTGLSYAAVGQVQVAVVSNQGGSAGSLGASTAAPAQ